MIVLDVETTGLDEKRNSIIEIGAIDYSNPKNRFFVNCQAKYNDEINNFALKINGHTKEDIYDVNKPTQYDAINMFHDWLSTIKKDATIIGQNSKMDLGFMNQMYRDSNMKPILGHRSIDLHSLTIESILRNEMEIPIKKNSIVSNVNSDWIMNYVGIPNEPKPHRGINGAIYETEAFSRVVFGKKLLDEFKGYPVPKYLKF